MRYVGIDVHLRMSAVCILNENGKKEKEFTFKGHFSKLAEALQEIPSPFAICFEASYSYGFLYGVFSRIADRVEVAHPGQLRLIFRSKRKNDRVDAEKLAKLLFLDEVPPVYVPNLNVREWRDAITFRSSMVNNRTATKNRLRALLKTHGIESPKGLWSKSGLEWLANLEFPSDSSALKRDLLLEELAHHSTRIARVEKHLAAIAKTHPGVALLRTIPGVGPRTAEAMVAWIDQPERFSKNKSIGSYFGLVPCQDKSAGKERLGHITRQGPALVRRLLTEASWQAIRRSPEVRRTFERIQQGDPKKKRKIALIAIAHYLARVMLAMLNTGQGWNTTIAAG
jgi:transposase